MTLCFHISLSSSPLPTFVLYTIFVTHSLSPMLDLVFPRIYTSFLFPAFTHPSLINIPLHLYVPKACLILSLWLLDIAWIIRGVCSSQVNKTSESHTWTLLFISYFTSISSSYHTIFMLSSFFYLLLSACIISITPWYHCLASGFLNSFQTAQPPFLCAVVASTPILCHTMQHDSLI